MVRIEDLQLVVTTVDDHPASRRVCVDYALDVEPDDPVVGRFVEERTVVRAVDEHDAAVAPSDLPVVEVVTTFTASAGRRRRTVYATVHRLQLDVEGDWWAADLGGEPLPIAEWLDHLVAEVELLVDGHLVATATTPVLTGSWGVLGHD